MPSYTVFVPDPRLTESKGFGRVCHVPSIFDGSPRYHRHGSRYLIDLATGAWSSSGQSSKLTSRTLEDYASWLANFLEWADVRGISLNECDFRSHIQDRYLEEMQSGLWGRFGKRLKPRTINPRTNIACDFLTWLAAKGYRPPFVIPGTITSTHSSLHHLRRNHNKSKIDGIFQEPAPTSLIIPRNAVIRKWLTAVNAKYGRAKTLMCEVILMTGLRRSEVTGLRIDTIHPNPESWRVINPTAPKNRQLVKITVKFGTKGKEYGKDNGDKIGPSRNITIPVFLAHRILEYINKTRPLAVRNLLKSTQSVAEKKKAIAESVHLFLDDRTGKRIKSKDLYNAWTGVELPFKGWSPHKGRHWWACSTLWQKIIEQRQYGKHGNAIDTTASLRDVIRLAIMPQLGHRHEDTCEIYLEWAKNMMSESLPDLYEAYLDSYPE